MVPGVDMTIQMSGGGSNLLQGYRVEACSGGQCIDITYVGEPSPGGLKAAHPDGPVLYGTANFDLAAAWVDPPI